MKTLEMMFGGGANVAQLAEMIRRFGRGEDKILAHITPEEAAMLKEAGGSGEINPMTGLPEFQEDDYGRLLASEGEYGEPANQAQEFDVGRLLASESDYGRPATQGPIDFQQGSFGGSQFAQQPSYLPSDSLQEMEIADMQRGEVAPVGGRQVDQQDESVFGRAESGLQRLKAALDRNPALTRVGGAGANILAQAMLARRATRGREAEATRLREQAQPFRAAQTEAMERARGGGLTPQQARAFEIQQARARQGLSEANRGTGSAAAGILAGQEQRTRSTARQESLDSALELARIVNSYDRAAIQEELTRDQELSQLLADVVGKEIQAATRTQAPQRRQ